jgi:hypothetical protein
MRQTTRRLAITVTAALLTFGSGAAGGVTTEMRVERDWYPNGTLRLEAHYRGDVLHGAYRIWYADGQSYQLRHYAGGRERGSQQAWTPTGKLYLNYEVWNGRRYGYVNAQPCLPVPEGDRSS